MAGSVAARSAGPPGGSTEAPGPGQWLAHPAAVEGSRNRGGKLHATVPERSRWLAATWSPAITGAALPRGGGGLAPTSGGATEFAQRAGATRSGPAVPATLGRRRNDVASRHRVEAGLRAGPLQPRLRPVARRQRDRRHRQLSRRAPQQAGRRGDAPGAG